MNRSTLAGSALLLAGILTACSSGSTPAGKAATTPGSTSNSAGSSSSASMGSKPAGAPMITIKNFAFAVTGQVRPGEKITVHNEDSEAHTVTADSGNAFNIMVPASSTMTLTAPGKAGAYKFHCNIHSNMHASLTVA